MSEFLTVSELTGQIKRIVENEFSEITLIGEISNFKAHFSGHWYFTLKDSGAQINAVMWRGLNDYVFFTPQDGIKVIVRGKITVYPPRGNYQIDVRSMKPAGEGELQAAFEKLKRKLSDEGLFNPEFKKEIPQLPEKIGVVTAIDGAAIKDIISVAERRYPIGELVIAASKVQGDGAAESIVSSIKKLNKRDDIDLIIVARGGGSLEDLWAFNEEIVARAIFNSKIPVISGVGHEVDFTIADFVADLRAPTPTAAMELATPDVNDFFTFIDEFLSTSSKKLGETVFEKKELIDQVLSSYGFRLPQDSVKTKFQLLDNIAYRIQKNINNHFQKNISKLELLKSGLAAHNIDKILSKGFAIVKQNNQYVTRASQLSLSDSFKIKFYDDEVGIKSNGKKENKIV
ncbi:MAG: exodeoxyribonuclease VII large subunit [Melioribacteraceae bacterium]|nr:exodeoxyribonuclease VII large subunit [Melioribacteraceae bacterium]MCF8353103.1 exodeoxyribonuclease VII large subunit [Melioribacteraceae bacterium]MCF8392751.1 exodeoxyribonuclease VII large subunit [Melioribacteraceae bacterium]MCF8418282.1 exodeoxyribonuclease VII large subunit [Melioribacteraceae bacterium]